MDVYGMERCMGMYGMEERCMDMYAMERCMETYGNGKMHNLDMNGMAWICMVWLCLVCMAAMILFPRERVSVHCACDKIPRERVRTTSPALLYGMRRSSHARRSVNIIDWHAFT